METQLWEPLGLYLASSDTPRAMYSRSATCFNTTTNPLPVIKASSKSSSQALQDRTFPQVYFGLLQRQKVLWHQAASVLSPAKTLACSRRKETHRQNKQNFLPRCMLHMCLKSCPEQMCNILSIPSEKEWPLSLSAIISDNVILFFLFPVRCIIFTRSNNTYSWFFKNIEMYQMAYSENHFLQILTLKVLLLGVGAIRLNILFLLLFLGLSILNMANWLPIIKSGDLGHLSSSAS